MTTTTPQKHKQQDTRRPETISALILVWAIAIGGELIHQIITVVSTLVDPSSLKAAVKESADQSGVASESLVNISVYAGITVMGLISLAIVGLLAWMLTLFAKRHKWAGHARRLLFVFSFFYAFRMMMVFVATSVASEVPIWLVAIDGALQIVVAVAAICGIIFAGREETLEWTGEDKEIEKFLKEREQREEDKKKSGKGS